VLDFHDMYRDLEGSAHPGVLADDHGCVESYLPWFHHSMLSGVMEGFCEFDDRMIAAVRNF